MSKTKFTPDQKYFYVAWETKGSSDLDDCALHGPHDHETAVHIKENMHRAGLKASVIDCTRSLQKTTKEIAALEMFEALETAIKRGVLRLLSSEEAEQIERALAKARGEL